MLLPFHLGTRSAFSVALLAFLAGTLALANPIAQVDPAPALLARGSVYAGGNCTTNSDCYSKNCVSKKCQLQPSGGPCFENGNCVSKSCSIPKGKTNGTCATTGSLYPKAACSANAQCLSGSCASLVDVHDQYGDETGTYFKDDPNHHGKNCQYFGLGQSGCRSNLDCSRGVCTNNKCTALADGRKCLFSYQCANVCSPSGTCYTPAAGSVKTGQPCNQDSQCYGQSCATYNLHYTRPNSLGTGNVTLLEKTCDLAYYNRPCYTDKDCYDGACLPTNSTSSTLTCQLRALGQPCPRNNACASGICSTKTKKCDRPTTGHLCTSDSQCFSNDCSTGYCYGSGPDYQDCPYSACNAVPYLGTCRFDQDCGTADGNFCNKGQCDNESYHRR